MSLYWPAEKEAKNPLDSPVALVVSLTNKAPLLEMALLGKILPVNPNPVCTAEPEVVLPRKTWKITHLYRYLKATEILKTADLPQKLSYCANV